MAGKGAGADDIMPAGKLKPLLMLSKREPVNCAIALAKDKSGLILLDKKAKPRALSALMKKKAGAAGVDLDTGTLRFGRAEVDTDVDPGLVTFTLNKQAPASMRPKMLEHLKKAGFARCEFGVDEAIEAEPEEAEAGEGEPAAPAVAAPAADAAHNDLAALVKRIPGVIGADPFRKDELLGLANAANAASKSGDAAKAHGTAEALRQALESAPAPGAAPAAAGPSGAALQTIAKTRQAWLSARAKVESELEKLLAGMNAAYQGHGFSADLEKVFHAKIEPMLSTLDKTLADKLDEVTKNTDAATHSKLVQEAQGIIQKYESYLQGEPMIKKLDANPFVPVAVEKTLVATLAALNKAMSTVAAH